MRKLILFVIVVIVIVMMWQSMIHFYPSFKPNGNLLSRKDLLSQVKTGDLIFLSGETYGEKSIKLYTWSDFSHVAFVVRDGYDEPYLWEADVGQGYRDGPRIIKLKDKLSKWRGAPYGAWKKSKKEMGAEKILEIIKKYVSYDMDNSMFCWLFSSFPKSYVFNSLKTPKTLFCSELLALTLQGMKVLDDDHHPSSYSPEDFFSDDANYFHHEYFSTK